MVQSLNLSLGVLCATRCKFLGIVVHRRQFLKIYSLKFCDLWQNFYFYCILNNENFKMEVEETNFVIHLIIMVQWYYWLSKNPSVKMWSNKFQMVIINYSKMCANIRENLMSEFYVKWAKVKLLLRRRAKERIRDAQECIKVTMGKQSL